MSPCCNAFIYSDSSGSYCMNCGKKLFVEGDEPDGEKQEKAQETTQT